MTAPAPATVALVTLGCARNDVDSDELAARLEQGGLLTVADPDDADAVLVNTCGFIEAAKKDSIDTVLGLADGRDDSRPVIAVGCMAERYGAELAAALPEARAVLGFDAYPDIVDRVGAILAGERPVAHAPRDRRQMLPLAPVDRHPHQPGPVGPDLPAGVAPASGPRPVRRRLAGGPTAAVKLASGCDRRCSFCAIPTFRGAFVSRPPAEVVAEARWLADDGVRELFLVSENTTSYGKDLTDVRLLERLLPELADVVGIDRVRLSYLQPAEMRPGLIDAMCATPGVLAYFDLSFQHASAAVLRRMRRFGDGERFLGLLDEVRRRQPLAGIRSNVIVGFPGETEDDLRLLEDFLVAARLDVVGVFGYSDEDGTEAAGLDVQLPADEIRERVERVTALVDELVAQRAEDRVGERVEVLVEQVGSAGVIGRAAHQGPDVDGCTRLTGAGRARVGALVAATVTGSAGADLTARTEGAR